MPGRTDELRHDGRIIPGSGADMGDAASGAEPRGMEPGGMERGLAVIDAAFRCQRAQHVLIHHHRVCDGESRIAGEERLDVPGRRAEEEMARHRREGSFEGGIIRDPRTRQELLGIGSRTIASMSSPGTSSIDQSLSH
jgi:hypothetical protein